MKNRTTVKKKSKRVDVAAFKEFVDLSTKLDVYMMEFAYNPDLKLRDSTAWNDFLKFEKMKAAEGPGIKIARMRDAIRLQKSKEDKITDSFIPESAAKLEFESVGSGISLINVEKSEVPKEKNTRKQKGHKSVYVGRAEIENNGL